MTRRIFIIVEYDGAPFVGWQRQDNGITVQQKLEDAAHAFTGEKILFRGLVEPIQASMRWGRLPISMCRKNLNPTALWKR
jgi:tRNA U38,U39,U40 pseudouridine synthase TruA